MLQADNPQIFSLALVIFSASLSALSPDMVQLPVVSIMKEGVEVKPSGGVRDGQLRECVKKEEDSEKGDEERK